MKRARPEEEFRFEPEHTFRLASFGRDKNYHVLYLRPTILTADIGRLALVAFGRRIQLQPDGEAEVVPLRDRVYRVYDTHALAQDDTHTYACYVTDSIDASLHWLPRHVPNFERGVQFFPWDVNPEEQRIKVDSRRIAQCTPQWVRGEVTGTKAYNLIGFWVPTERQDPNWTLDGDRVFDAKSLENMQFGKDNEDLAVMLYIQHTGNKVRNVGSYRAPHPYPSNWTASPDGIVNGGQGVLEIKSSQKSLDMEPYFVPQVYMEMLCTSTQWTHVVRFCPPRARIYTVHRDPDLEARLLVLIKRGIENKDRLQRLVHTDQAYIDMRAELRRLAKSLPYEEVEASEPTRMLFEAYRTYRRL